MSSGTKRVISSRQTGDEFTLKVIPLLIDYTQKLNRIVDQTMEHLAVFRSHPKDAGQRAEAERTISLLKTLLSPCHDLAQMVSQRIEHGKLGEVERIELRLRLAELEALVNLIPRLMSELMQAVSA